MRRYKVLILLFVFTIVSLSSCPNNCNNHGVCTAGGVCKCSEGSGVGESGLMYVGADCSDRSCPSGFSYGTLAEPVSVNPHVGNSGTVRELSVGVLKTNMSRSLENVIIGDIMSVSRDCKIESVDNNIGIFKCYDELNGNIGYMKLYGRNDENGEYYISKKFDDNEIPMDSVLCKLELEFSDLSLYHDSIIEGTCQEEKTCQIKWVGMSEIMENSSFKFENGEYSFLCGDKTVVFTKSTSDKDIIFKNKASETEIATGTKCNLLATIGKDGKISYDSSKVDYIYNKLPKLGKKIVIDDSTVFYEINNPGIALPDNNYGLLDCYNRYSDNYLGKAYLYHQKTDNGDKYYIKFEFKNDDDISDYRLELIESYNDISLIYTSKVNDGCVAKGGDVANALCTITWPNMKTILGTSEGTGDLSFECINSTNYITEYKSWTAAAAAGIEDNIIFTIGNTAEKVPNKDDKCVLLASVASGKLGATSAGASSFESKNVIQIGKSDKMYVNELTTIQFTLLKDNIYYAENINYMIGKVGSILLCTKGNVESELILMKKETLETKDADVVIDVKSVIYVHDRNNKVLSGSYTCKVIKLLDDYSLINPITVSDNNCKADGCTLEWKSMSYFVKEIFNADKDVKLACENKTGLITEYEFTVKTIDPAETDSKSTSAVIFDKKTDIPSVGDICHYIGTSSADLTVSDYGKELNTFILLSKDKYPIPITKREKQSDVYEVVNYKIHNSKSYVGKLYCQNVNGKNGNGYLMGKKGDKNYYILYDLDVVNINDYICILTEIYNDISLFNSVKVLGQGSGENGICYEGQCDIKWSGMNSLLKEVDLVDGKPGSAYIASITKEDKTDGIYFVCSDKKNNINIYEYNKPTVDNDDIIFKVNEKNYPSVGDICSSFTNFDGTNIDTTLNSLKFIESDYGKANKDNIITQIYLMDKTGLGSDPKIYQVKGIKLDDDSFEIGILKCKKNGVSVGYSTVYKRDKASNIFYIKYNFLGKDITPVPSDYTYSIIEKYSDLSLLFTTNVLSDCKANLAASCDLSIENSYDIIKQLYKDISTTSVDMNFLCFESVTKKMQIFKYKTVQAVGDNNDLKFTIDTSSTSFPLAGTKCYIASDVNFTPIDIENKDNAFIRLLKSTVNNIKIYEVINMDKLISSGIGSLKCYNKYSNEYIGIGRMWGKDGSDSTINYISFENDKGDIDNPTPEIYNCKVDKMYSDYSIYPPIKVESECKDKTCSLTWSRMKPIIDGIKIKTEDLSFKCINGDKTQYVKLTTTNPNPIQRLLVDDLTLYLKSGEVSDGYKCYMNVKSDGTNIDEKEENESDKLTKILSIKTTLDSDKKVYEISNIVFPGEKGVGSQKCRINGATEYESVYFMGKKDKNYFVRFESKTFEVGDILTTECTNTSYLNDLSNYYPLNNGNAECSTGSVCTITWTGIKPLLPDFPISDTPNENLKIWCVSGNDLVKVDSGITASNSPTANDIIFSFAATIAKNTECHLIVNFNGSVITDPLKSDFGKTLNGDGTIPFIDTGDANGINFFGDRKLYKVKNVKYDNLTTNIGELKCTNTASEILGTAYVMGYKTDYYLIDYSFTKDKPTPKDYKCEVQKVYNDLSLLFDIYTPSSCIAASERRRSLGTTAKCEISLSGLDEVFTALGIEPTNTDLVCYNGVSKKYKLYTFDISSFTGKVDLKIKEDSTSVPADHDKCQMLLDSKGKDVLLSKSDFGIKNNIKIDKPDENTEIKVKDNTPKVTSKEEASIPPEMPVTGGIIKCYDKISGEYYGTASVIGSNDDGETIIIYNFEVPDGVEHDPSDYISEISSTRNDFSETNPPKVEGSICSSSIGYCKLLWKNMGSILGSKLLTNRLRLLVDYNIPVSCANSKDGLLSSYNGVPIGKNGDGDLEISLDVSKKYPKADDICHVLVDGEGNGKEITASDLMRSVKTNANGEMILVTAVTPTIPSGKISVIGEGGSNAKGNTEYYVYINGKNPTESVKLLGDMQQKGVFVMNKPEGQYAKNILSHLVVGNHITIQSIDNKNDFSSTTETSCTITSIDKNYNYQTPTSSPRLLNEERELSVGDSTGELIGITAIDDKGKNYKLPNSHLYVKITFKDCDNSNPDLFCAHECIECSGVGICDRESGECKCYNGFSGSACERMDCPNNCNNHGRCIKVSDKLLNNEYPSIFGSISGSEMIFGCKCDSGYRGSDCSLKECASEEGSDRDCSNHGICDYSDGSCKCFDGYYGDGCQNSITS